MVEESIWNVNGILIILQDLDLYDSSDPKEGFAQVCKGLGQYIAKVWIPELFSHFLKGLMIFECFSLDNLLY